MTNKERIELAKIGVLTGEDAKRFHKAIANPKKVSAEEIARIKESASSIIDKTNPRVNELDRELSLLTEKYNKLEEAFDLLLVDRIKCDDSDHQKVMVYWNDLAGLKEQ